jgi:hypothetical protein
VTPTWITLLCLLALALAAAGFLVLRRVQTRVPDAPLVELATVPADRGFWLRSRLTESLGGGRPAAPPLDSLDLGEDLLVESPVIAPVVTAPAPAVTAVPLAMPLAATRPAAPLGHSPFANQAVRNGRIGLMDEHDDAPEIAWRTHTAAPTSFSDATAAPVAPASSSDPSAPITLDRHPDTIEWAGPTD